jgi:hypothetical protein
MSSASWETLSYVFRKVRKYYGAKARKVSHERQEDETRDSSGSAGA